MGQDVDGRPVLFLAQSADQLEPMLTNAPAVFRIFVRDFTRRLKCDPLPFLARFCVGHAFELPLDRPPEIYGGRPGGSQLLSCRHQIGFERREIHPVGRRRTYQSGAAHLHLLDGSRHFGDALHIFNDELMRQKPLVDNLDDPLVARLWPDSPVMLPPHVHELLECDQEPCKARGEIRDVYRWKLSAYPAVHASQTRDSLCSSAGCSSSPALCSVSGTSIGFSSKNRSGTSLPRSNG